VRHIEIMQESLVDLVKGDTNPTKAKGVIVNAHSFCKSYINSNLTMNATATVSSPAMEWKEWNATRRELWRKANKACGMGPFNLCATSLVNTVDLNLETCN